MQSSSSPGACIACLLNGRADSGDQATVLAVNVLSRCCATRRAQRSSGKHVLRMTITNAWNARPPLVPYSE